MKKNLPVTDKEQLFGESEELVSSTDLKGSITYANETFCNIAQFSSDELVGKNHNMVRHPDVPPAAFGDLWSNLKLGKPWRGVVKNRCKNGDHYWVDAFVMPVFENGKICAYESVRVKPSEGQKLRAQILYDHLNQGKKHLPKQPIIRLTMTQLQILVIILSLLPVFLTAAIIPGMGYLALALGLSLLIGVSGTLLINKGMRIVMNKAKTIVDNPLNEYMYTGGYSDSHKIMAAFGMQETQNRTLLGRVKESSKHVGEQADKNKLAVEKVHQQISQQQYELEQIASAMTEMLAAIQEIASNSGIASSTADEGNRSVFQGQKVANAAVKDINELVIDINNVSEALGNLKSAVEGISSMVQVINDIAEQTNMLALNAAIEAARAGDQGRGFAVVADEVRTLASRTQSSTTEIQQQIERLQESSSQAIQAMDAGKEKAQHNLSNTTELEESLNAVIQSVNSIQEMNAATATAAEQQNSTTEEMNRNVVAISDRASETQSIADLMKQQGVELSGFACQLSDLVARFRLN